MVSDLPMFVAQDPDPAVKGILVGLGEQDEKGINTALEHRVVDVKGVIGFILKHLLELRKDLNFVAECFQR